MGLIEDITSMQEEGRDDNEIRSVLRQKGISEPEINGAMSQVLIKGAVNQNYEYPEQNTPYQESQYPMAPTAQNVPQSYEGMEPSLLTQPYSQNEMPQTTDAYSNSGEAYNYAQYQPYQESFSPDVISEIAEQVVADKLSILNEKIEQIIDFKTLSDTKLKNLEERIERIERVFDKLQLSLLQKVAEYVDDVKTLKTEVQETQKSFRSLITKKSG